jgi:hypothetical protein
MGFGGLSAVEGGDGGGAGLGRGAGGGAGFARAGAAAAHGQCSCFRCSAYAGGMAAAPAGPGVARARRELLRRRALQPGSAPAAPRRPDAQQQARMQQQQVGAPAPAAPSGCGAAARVGAGVTGAWRGGRPRRTRCLPGC